MSGGAKNEQSQSSSSSGPKTVRENLQNSRALDRLTVLPQTPGLRAATTIFLARQPRFSPVYRAATPKASDTSLDKTNMTTWLLTCNYCTGKSELSPVEQCNHYGGGRLLQHQHGIQVLYRNGVRFLLPPARRNRKPHLSALNQAHRSRT